MQAAGCRELLDRRERAVRVEQVDVRKLFAVQLLRKRDRRFGRLLSTTYSAAF